MMPAIPIPPEVIGELTEIVFGTPHESLPLPCDLIFVFGGSHPGLWETAAQAYTLGLGPVVLVTGGHKPGVKYHYTWHDGATPESHVIRRELIRLQVPENRIVCEDRSTNTLENVLFALEVYDFSTVHRILAVCKNYGVGRQCRTLRKHIRKDIQVIAYPFDAEVGSEGALITTPAGSVGPRITRHTWMNYERGRALVLAQVRKIIQYGKQGDLEPLERISPALVQLVELT